MDIITDPKVDLYRCFIARLRFKDLKTPYLVVKHLYPKVTQYVTVLKDLDFNTEKAHTVYSTIKNIISSFIEYYNATLNEVIKLTIDYRNTLEKDDVLQLVQMTIEKQTTNQVEFDSEYLPVKSPQEQEMYEKIQLRYNETMCGLADMVADICRLDKQFKVEKYLDDHFPVSVIRHSKLLRYTHGFLGLMLSRRLKQIDIIVEEMLLNACNNLKDIRFQCEDVVNRLLHLLYDKNKEWIYLQRASREITVDTYEVERSIEMIRWKIKNHDPTVAHLDSEVVYWTKASAQIDKVANTLSKLLAEYKNVKKQYDYIQSDNSDLEGDQRNAAVQKLLARGHVLHTHVVQNSRALLTLFATRGNNEVMHRDARGLYHVDAYNHQVYHLDNLKGSAHVDCDGQLHKYSPDDCYYFDNHGRYVLNGGRRIYKVASCTSMYELDKDTNYFRKITHDCGHSERSDRICYMDLHSLHDEILLPKVTPVEHARSLAIEAVDYLYTAFAHVLPLVLSEVARIKPRNPVHFIAHQLLRHSHRLPVPAVAAARARFAVYKATTDKNTRDKQQAARVAWRRRNLPNMRWDNDDEQMQNLIMSQCDHMLLQMLADFNMNY